MDIDGDGYLDVICGGEDCDDFDFTVYPGADDTCDGVDQNCEGDEEEDIDEDGYFNCDDCDDDPTDDLEACDTCLCGEPWCGNCARCVNPGMPEIIDNGVDDDCDPTTPDHPVCFVGIVM